MKYFTFLTKGSQPKNVNAVKPTGKDYAHVRSNIRYVTCVRYLIGWRTGIKRICSPERPIFLHVCASCSKLPSIWYSYQRKFNLCLGPRKRNRKRIEGNGNDDDIPILDVHNDLTIAQVYLIESTSIMIIMGLFHL